MGAARTVTSPQPQLLHGPLCGGLHRPCHYYCGADHRIVTPKNDQRQVMIIDIRKNHPDLCRESLHQARKIQGVNVTMSQSRFPGAAVPDKTIDWRGAVSVDLPVGAQRMSLPPQITSVLTIYGGCWVLRPLACMSVMAVKPLAMSSMICAGQRSRSGCSVLVGRLEASLHVGLQCCHVRLGARWEVTPEVAALSSLQGVDDADTGDL